jgi:hypothetical protein
VGSVQMLLDGSYQAAFRHLRIRLAVKKVRE